MIGNLGMSKIVIRVGSRFQADINATGWQLTIYHNWLEAYLVFKNAMFYELITKFVKKKVQK